jgi:glycosyltransferase involved in cell wall biosynthesis
MNRLVTDSTARIDPADLPPARRSPGGPARVLFLHTTAVGFATTTANLEHYAGARPDLDAVHVRVVAPRWYRWVCRQSPVPIGELDFRYLRHMLASRRLIGSLVGPGRALPLERFDVVHILTQQRAAAVPRLTHPARNPTGTRFAVNLDATLPGWESMRGLPRLAPRLDHVMERRILQSADLVACASEWAATSAEHDSRVDPRRIVIHRPCARVTPSLCARERPAGVLPALLFIGGDWKDKGGARLLAWHQARWSSRATLHVVSASAPRDDRARNVVWHGRVEHARLVNEIIPACDLLVVPTRWDTFLIAAQEAQAAGLPVVTTRTGAVPEVVRDAETGLLCGRDRDDEYIAAVERLLDDAQLRARMGQAAARHAVENLNADVWHNHLLDQLVALADGRPLTRTPAGRGASS